MRKIACALIVVVGALSPAAAHAYDDGGYRGRDDCRDGGGCHNRRHEDYGDNSCKYVCPKFDKSPVQDSFNLTVCVMPGSCTGDDKKKEPPKG